MTDETNVTDDELRKEPPIADDYIFEDEEDKDKDNNEEEIPMEQKKKAVNVEDLVFVRQYIDNKMRDELPGQVDECLGSDYYKKTETDETFYKRTDVVDNALEAAHAVKADEANEAGHAVSADEADKADKAGYATSAGNANSVNNVKIGKNMYGVLHADGKLISQKIRLFTDTEGKSSITLSEPINLGDKIEMIYSISKKTNPTSYQTAQNITTFMVNTVTLNGLLKNEHITNMSSSYNSSSGITSVTSHHLSFDLIINEVSDNAAISGIKVNISGIYVKETWGKRSTTADSYLDFVPIEKSDTDLVDDADVKIYGVYKIIDDIID